MNFPEAVQYLYSFLNYEVQTNYSYPKDLNLERTAYLLRRFGSPETRFPSVLVAGTKGKGSTAFLLETLLREGGYRVGLFTSPHLEDIRERLRISGRMITKGQFAELAGKIRDSFEGDRRPSHLGQSTFFEVLTVLAMLYFARERVQLGIFEVGMGGRLDATNILRPRLCLLSPISYDHQDKLGKSLRSIAGEKVAVLKPGGVLVSARQPHSARQILKAWVKKQEAKAFFLGEDFSFRIRSMSSGGSRFDFLGCGIQLKNLFLRMPGLFQAENASLALEAALLLRNSFPMQEASVRRGLAQALWPGRFEIVKRNRWTYVLDGAHNGASIKALFENLALLFPGKRVSLVIGVSRDKDIRRIFQAIQPHAPSVVITQSDHPRAMKAEELLLRCKRYFSHNGLDKRDDLREAIVKARREAGDRLICVTGSLFLVARARKLLCPN